MTKTLANIFFVIFLAFLILNPVNCQILTPPLFNLAKGRRVIASATCGEDVQRRVPYCQLVGVNDEGKQKLICDHCDPSNPKKHHPAEKAVDGEESWWQSPPLSKGMKYNEVNLTIDLGQEFHVEYVSIKMGNSPRPGVWVLERSSDYGQTFQPWQYFADSQGNCQLFFGSNITFQISADDSVICDTQYSEIGPLDGAEYYYSVRDINIGGRCSCNGHADICDIKDPYDASQLICNCQHNTCGHNCERCCPGYVLC